MLTVLHNVWWLLVLIGVMILIHELGHYWAARFFDVRVDAFSFGFGPRLFGFKKGETDFRFCLILFGGYVKMAGEQASDEGVADPRGFLSKPRWQRLIIAFAGPFMNILLAIGLLTGLFMVHYPKLASASGPALIGHIQPGSPAEKAGLREGDHIVQINDRVNPDWEDVSLKVISSAKRVLTIGYERNGQRLVTTVTPILDDRQGVGTVGWSDQNEIQIRDVTAGMPAAKAGLKPGDVLVSINGQQIRSEFKLIEVIRSGNGGPVDLVYKRGTQVLASTLQPVFSAPDKHYMIGVAQEPLQVVTKLPLMEALSESIRQNVKGATAILEVLRGMIERRVSPKNLEGPIRIAQISGEAARQGATVFVGLMAMVSLNLAIFNLLPIPILDGGVILMLLIEMLMRRDLSLSVKEAVFKVGFVFLMMIVGFVLYNDLSKILPS